MTTTRPFDSDYDSDEPSICRSVTRPTESDDNSDEPLMTRSAKRPFESSAEDERPQAKMPKTKTKTDERLASHFSWMDAIHNTTKYGMQEIVDEMQERIDQLGEDLATSKEEARLARTANVALGALTVRHTELMKTKDALQEELYLAKNTAAINVEAEKERDDLREALRRANDRLRLKEAAEEKAAEIHKKQFKAREDRIRSEYSENAKNEAWKLKAEWEAWCKAGKLSLDKRTKMIIQGDMHFTELKMKTAVEIIRCSDPENATLFQHFIWTARPGLEYEAYPTNPLPNTTRQDIIATHGLIQKKLPVQLNDACCAIRRYLCKQRRSVLGCVRSHPYYGRCGQQTRIQMNQECIDFFDRRYTFQVIKLMSNQDWSPAMGAPTMSLGVNEDTAILRGIVVGSYQDEELKEMDEKFWRALPK